jgi:hypothetical protein
VSEGLAEYVKYYAGYLSNSSYLRGDMTQNTTMSSTYFATFPTVSLIFFDEDFESYASYGFSYLFFFYLAEKYGVEVIKTLSLYDSIQGPKALEQSLLDNGYNISFNELFLDVVTACSIDELGINDDQYGFRNADFQVDRYRSVSNYPKTFSNIKHRYYCVELKELNNLPNEFTLIVETPDSSTKSLGIVIIFRDDNGWSIEQQILPGTGTKEYLYFTGENVGEALIITSLVKEGITFAPTSFSTSPSSLLNLTITEGHQKPTKTIISIIGFTTAFLLISQVFVIRKRKKRRKE